MKARAVTRVVLAAALALPASLTGCSLMASRPPPETPLVSADQCSSRRFPPTADVLWSIGTSNLALLLWGVAWDQYEGNKTTIVPSWDQRPLSVDSSLIVDGAILTAATIAFVASATYGYKSASDCKKARLEFLRTHPPAWPPGAAYPYAYPPGAAYPYAYPPGTWPPPPRLAPSTDSALAPSTEVPSGPLDVAPPPRSPALPVKRSARVVAASAEVRSAPFNVAPVVVVLAQGQRLFVDVTSNAGWRVATLLDGRVGYIQDSQVKVDSP